MAQGSSSSESSLWIGEKEGIRDGEKGIARRDGKREREGEEQLEDSMHCYIFHFFSNIPHLGPGNFLELWNLLYNCCTCTLPRVHSHSVPILLSKLKYTDIQWLSNAL